MADAVFLALRVVAAGLSLYAAWVCVRQARGYAGHPGRAFRAGVGAVISVLLGILALAIGLREAVFQRGEPIPAEQWIYTVVAIVLPLFFLYLLDSFAQRDELERQLAEAAHHDPLTGLPNRTGHAARALSALAACRAAGRPATIAVMDVDRFKSINDGWGHAAGDAVLCGIARALRSGLREDDVPGRVGGEEFSLLLGNVTSLDALLLVDRLRGAIAREVPHPGAPAESVTVSAGIAVIDGEGQPAIEEATRRADAALYAAKHAGRDQAMIAGPEQRSKTG